MFPRLLGVLTLASVAGFAVPPAVALESPAEPEPPASGGSTLITDWNAIAQRVIFDEAATPVPESSLYLSYVSLAVYDAIVAIEGRYEQYVQRDRDFGPASPEVAAATAATVILRHYFPDAADGLRDDYSRSLTDVPRGLAYQNGARAGIAAAAALLVGRLGDGRGGPAVVPEVALEPGAWRPTPPDFAPMEVPRLGFVEPFILESPTQFTLPEPNPLGSDTYAEDFEEVKRDGDRAGLGRTAAQTETALFFSVNPMVQYLEGLRDLVMRRDLDILDSARAFALFSTSAADSLISCSRANAEHPAWRPITAIRLAGTDGNDATEPDADWEPLAATPPYPESASEHACLTGAASGSFSHLFGSETVDLNLNSARSEGPTPPGRQYKGTMALDRDAMDAQVWLGISFRSSLRSANELGHDVADWTAANHFRPTGKDRAPGTRPSRGEEADWQPAMGTESAISDR